ncbi:MAG: DUF4258 domain-containing protein [Nitrospirae bacterium]|nr:MAG: DUF4258 domain-containing protein [Nitrospirota bacterium]
MKPHPITDYIFSDHAKLEIMRRGLSQETVRAILLAPEQQFEARPGRVALQSRVSDGRAKKRFLIRVFVDVDRPPAEVVTAYRTSRIAKYWREQE